MDSAFREAVMPWRAVSVMKQRREFIELFRQEDVNRQELCRRFGISRTVAYKWLFLVCRGGGGRGGCWVGGAGRRLRCGWGGVGGWGGGGAAPPAARRRQKSTQKKKKKKKKA